MSSSFSSHVDNSFEWLHNKKCRKCNSCLDYISIENNELICKCMDCNKNYKLHKHLINRFANSHEFCNKDINKYFVIRKKNPSI